MGRAHDGTYLSRQVPGCRSTPYPESSSWPCTRSAVGRSIPGCAGDAVRTSRIVKLLAVVPVALMVGIAACDNAQNMTAPQQKVSAQFSANGGPHRVIATVSPAHNSAL